MNAYEWINSILSQEEFDETIDAVLIYRNPFTNDKDIFDTLSGTKTILEEIDMENEYQRKYLGAFYTSHRVISCSSNGYISHNGGCLTTDDLRRRTQRMLSKWKEKESLKRCNCRTELEEVVIQGRPRRGGYICTNCNSFYESKVPTYIQTDHVPPFIMG